MSKNSLTKEHARFKAPFIMKMSFYSPSAQNQRKNAAHINYIGTRPGADMGIELDDPGAAGHVKYVHERPGSHGLFSAIGEKPNLEKIQRELREHQGIVWRVVLSLTEEDAKRLNFDTRKQWEEALRAAVPVAAAKMGIGASNLRWVAAFHQEQGHPHVHLVMWEREPKRSKGMLSRGERIDIKKVFMKQIYAEEQTRLYQEKTAMRDLIRDLAKGDTEKAISILDDVRREVKNVELEMQSIGAKQPGIAPKPYPDDLKALAIQLDELAKNMPGKGRAALKFMPVDVKAKARQIAEYLLQQPAFRESYDRYMKSVEDMTKLHTMNPEKIQMAKVNAHADLRDRVANQVIKAGAAINRHDVQIDHQDKKAERDAANFKTRLANSLWRSAWRSIEAVRIQHEAQGEMQKRQAERQRRLRQQQQHEANRER